HRRQINNRLLHSLFFFNDPPTTEIYTLSLHDALPIYSQRQRESAAARRRQACAPRFSCRRSPLSGKQLRLREAWKPPMPHERLRSEEHTSELQSPYDLVCRLLLEKKKKKKQNTKS